MDTTTLFPEHEGTTPEARGAAGDRPGPADPTAPPTTVQQLSLLPQPEVPLKFRLDAETRRRGLRHVAEIRQMLAERQAARENEQRRPFTPGRAA